MKYFFSVIAVAISLSFTYLDGFYSLLFRTVEGRTIDVSTFKGRKVMFVILPLSEQDTTVSIRELKELSKKHDTSLVIVGIGAEETGFKKGDGIKLKDIVAERSNSFFITEGIKVKKAAKEGQAPLLQWLTNHNNNKHFDNDASGIGQKFFVDEEGDLYAVMGPEVKLSNPVIERILGKPLARKR